ncbi:hypothetical protein D9757_011245 [Collybiopsis confluens]|uniref:NADH:flavin oxidoreductase/NADH oxidase N-terminal domain-containing protein n=1 Tax=Collybiopsis confluens TaxID=2823264 RepID=A0A8H5LRZ7_9AGAR|nr:hypothetical protein D9757_011245 [Collybiopsis confluens]
MSAHMRNRALPTNVPGNSLMIDSEWEHAPGIWNHEQIERWKKINEAIHEEGSLASWKGQSPVPEQIASGESVYGPSAIAARGGNFRFLSGSPGYVAPTEIPDPKKFVALFKQAAINAKEAGFGGVEVLAANGCLIHAFLDTGDLMAPTFSPRRPGLGSGSSPGNDRMTYSPE